MGIAAFAGVVGLHFCKALERFDVCVSFLEWEGVGDMALGEEEKRWEIGVEEHGGWDLTSAGWEVMVI